MAEMYLRKFLKLYNKILIILTVNTIMVHFNIHRSWEEDKMRYKVSARLCFRYNSPLTSAIVSPNMQDFSSKGL